MADSTQLTAPPGFSLAQIVRSHGWSGLLPWSWDGQTLRYPVVVDDAAYALVFTQSGASVEVACATGLPEADRLASMVQFVLDWDTDLDAFYAQIEDYTPLAWAQPAGAGRMLRCASVYENLAKLLATTNCSWALTKRMVTRIIEEHGVPTPGGPAFPPADRLAGLSVDAWSALGVGYRAPYFHHLTAQAVAGDLEAWPQESVDALAANLKQLPGFGPYAVGTALRILGHHGHTAADSWCRARFKELYPRTRKADAAIAKRYRRFGAWQGLAFWLEVSHKQIG